MVDSTIGYGITEADVPSLARIHRDAFPNFFLSYLGIPFLKQFYRGYVMDPTAVIAISRDGTGNPMGIAVGTIDPVGFFGRLLRRHFLGFVGASALAALRNPASVPRLLQALTYRGDTPLGQDGALLSSICVDPAQSNHGIGSQLMRAWIKKARLMGAEKAYLTTDAVDNELVNSWYLREGWVLSDTYIAHGEREMNRYEHGLGEVSEE